MHFNYLLMQITECKNNKLFDSLVAFGEKKLILHTLLIMLTVIPSLAQCQMYDDFSDGDFSQNPAWTGDTSKFRVNSNLQLQLYADSADSAQLSVHYAMPQGDTIIWHFWTKLAFSPTKNNYTFVALYSDSSNLLKSNNYISMAIGDPDANDKTVTLYRDDTLLMKSNYKLSYNTNTLNVKVQLVAQQFLTLWLDTVGDGNFFLADSTGTYPLIADSGYFGVYCRFTSSRAHSFYFDNIGINADSLTEDSPHGYIPKPGDILINEILFNPKPGGSDYVELTNNSDSIIPLHQLRLAQYSEGVITKLYPIADHGVVNPGEMIVVTRDAAYVSQNYTVPFPSRLIEVTSMPPYNDKQGTVVVTTGDSVVLDRFDYNEKMHSSLLHDREGVALERRSVDIGTQEQNNWYSASSTSGYGTPTARNSQSHEFLFLNDDFLAEPPLFSPDGDSYNDLLNISYSLTDCSLSCDITILDANGRIVRHLMRGALIGCDGLLTWDGTDDNGQRCHRGNYIIALTAYNTKGARQNWRRKISLVCN